MRLLHEILAQASALSCFVGAVALFRARLMRGRHISRPLVRRLGLRGAWLARWFLHGWWLGLVFGLVASKHHRVGFELALTTLAANAWIVDDWLYPDDRPKRKHEWARVRLRMPKPVKLRQVERWKPVPA